MYAFQGDNVAICHGRDKMHVEVEFHPGPFSQSWTNDVTDAIFDRSIDRYSLSILSIPEPFLHI